MNNGKVDSLRQSPALATSKQLEKIQRAIGECNAVLRSSNIREISLDDLLVYTGTGKVAIEDIDTLTGIIKRIQKNSTILTAATTEAGKYNLYAFVEHLSQDVVSKPAVQGDRGKRRRIWKAKGRQVI